MDRVTQAPVKSGNECIQELAEKLQQSHFFHLYFRTRDLKTTDQFVAAVLLFFSALMLVYPSAAAGVQPQAKINVIVIGLLGLFAGVLNLLRVAYMRNAAGLRVCSIAANALAVIYLLLHRALLTDELNFAQFSAAAAALIISSIHRPRVRINGLGQFKYGAGG